MNTDAIATAKECLAQAGITFGAQLPELFTHGDRRGIAQFSVDLKDDKGAVIATQAMSFVVDAAKFRAYSERNSTNG